MSRLSLDAFKAEANINESNELENLTGGILGACHCDRCGQELADDGLAVKVFHEIIKH